MHTSVEADVGGVSLVRCPPSTDIPVVQKEDADTRCYHFPAKLLWPLADSSSAANRLRGRYVIKMAAILYLTALPTYDRPGKCSEAMAYLWGHTRLAREYLRRGCDGVDDTSTYTSIQLDAAETKWKTHLGEQVLEPEGFQRCFDELAGFFDDSIEAFERDHGERSAQDAAPLRRALIDADNTPDDGRAASKRPASVRWMAHSGTPRGRFKTFEPAVHAASFPMRRRRQQQLASIAARDAVEMRDAPTLDLAVVPVSALSILYNNTVRQLRKVSPRAGVAAFNRTPEDAYLVERGWWPVLQILAVVRTALESDTNLKQLWAWMALLSPSEQTAIYIALLRPLNVLGKVQLLHEGPSPEESSSRATGETVLTTPVTHLRAAWGHTNKQVAAAVLQEHILVPVSSLACQHRPRKTTKGSKLRSSQAIEVGGAGADAGVGQWYEFVEDAKALEKEGRTAGGRVYPHYRPMQVLLPASTVERLGVPPAPLNMGNSVLSARIQRSNAPATGDKVAEASTRVRSDELQALLDVQDSWGSAAFVATMAGALPHSLFIPVSKAYFLRKGGDGEEESVLGRYIPQDLVCARPVVGSLQPPVDGTTITVTAPGSTTALLLYPSTSPTESVPHSASKVTSAATVEAGSLSKLIDPCVIGFDLLYDVHPGSSDRSCSVTVRRPTTETALPLRTASMWELWKFCGAREHSQVGEAVPSPGGLLQRDELALPLPPRRKGSAVLEGAHRSSATSAVGCSGEAHKHNKGGAPANASSSVCDGGCEGKRTATEHTDTAQLPSKYLSPHSWELFPGAQATELLLRLDAAYRAELRLVCERWAKKGALLLRPQKEDLKGEGSQATGDAFSAFFDTGALHANAKMSDAHLTDAEWRIREEMLWRGLERWMSALEQECTLPYFSFLLPPEVLLQDAKKKRSLGSIGRRKGLAALRCLVNGAGGTATIFRFKDIIPHSPPLHLEEHSMWVLEEGASISFAKPYHTTYQSRAGAKVGRSCTIAARPEVLLADTQTAEGKRVVWQYLCQPCVLRRPYELFLPSAVVAAETSADRQSSAKDTCRTSRRIARFVSSDTSRASATTPSGDGERARNMMEELSEHSPLRLAQRGRRLSPLGCDEYVLEATWPAEWIVDFALLPPLRAVLTTFRGRREAEARAIACIGEEVTGKRAKNGGDTVGPSVFVPTLSELDDYEADLRRELLCALTDAAAKELREFYGDALMDYCVMATTLSDTYAWSNEAVFCGGSVVTSTTNAALVTNALPGLLRRYWESQYPGCVGKRLADGVESLFGALVCSLWANPLKRRCDAVDVDESCIAVPLPDFDLLVYTASALLVVFQGKPLTGSGPVRRHR